MLHLSLNSGAQGTIFLMQAWAWFDFVYMILFSWLWYRARSWLEDTCGRASTAWNIGWFFCREGDIAQLRVERHYTGLVRFVKVSAYDRHTKQPVKFECHKGSTSVWGDPNSETLSMEFEHPQNFRKLKKTSPTVGQTGTSNLLKDQWRWTPTDGKGHVLR